MEKLQLTNTERKEQLSEYPELMIFDMDGTIVIEPEFYKRIYSGTLADTIRGERGEEGLKTLQYYRENFEGKGELALGALGIPFAKWAKKLNDAPLDEITAQPETVTTVRNIPSKKVVFTGSPKILAYRILSQFGFDPEKDFDEIIGWEEPEISPLKWNGSPFVFRSICQRMGINPDKTWSIGDNWESDLSPAQMIGTTTIQINKQTGNPDYQFRSIKDLIDSVEQKKKPYIVSGDTQLILREWADKKGFTMPDKYFFEDLRKDFSEFMQSIFPNFELVSEEQLRRESQNFRTRNNFPTITLDDNYFPSEYSLEITRLVDGNGNDKGLGRRRGTLPILRQFRKLQESGITEVNLFDDVGFSGDLLVRIINTLGKSGIVVKNVYLGIGIREAITKVQDLGIPVSSVKSYVTVLDEICERDFYPGVPQSGRSFNGDTNQGFPYILPFGNPEAWASIPAQYVKDLSLFCLNQSIKLFAEIEKVSKRMVMCRDLDRVPMGISPTAGRFVDELERIKQTL